jgi:hypothetical protein
MKLVRCDQCGFTEPSDQLYGNPPKAWLVVEREGTSFHFCSPGCAARYLDPGHVDTTEAPVNG